MEDNQFYLKSTGLNANHFKIMPSQQYQDCCLIKQLNTITLPVDT